MRTLFWFYGLRGRETIAEQSPYFWTLRAAGVNKVKGTDLLNKSSLVSEVEKFFKVIKTGAKKTHYTVELPKPVTIDATKVFNKLFNPNLINIKK